MRKIPGEVLIKSHSTKFGLLELTSCRVRYEQTGFGSAFIFSAVIGCVDACHVQYRSSPIFAVLGVLAGLGGLVNVLDEHQKQQSLALFLFFACAVLLIGFFLTLSCVLSITTGGKSTDIRIRGSEYELMRLFIDALESQKLQGVSPVLPIGGEGA